MYTYPGTCTFKSLTAAVFIYPKHLGSSPFCMALPRKHFSNIVTIHSHLQRVRGRSTCCRIAAQTLKILATEWHVRAYHEVIAHTCALDHLVQRIHSRCQSCHNDSMLDLNFASTAVTVRVKVFLQHVGFPALDV